MHSSVSFGATTFVYDGDGARVLQAVRSGGAVTTTAYVGAWMEVISATSTSAPPPGDLIFADGFESGTTSAWSAEVDGEGDLNVSSGAALVGMQGLAALIDNTTAMYVRDDTPSAEPRYRARFYFDPNSLTLPDSQSHDIFAGRSGSTNVVKVLFRVSSGAYQVRALLKNDAGSDVNSAYYPISDAAHVIEMDWAAATAAGANDGYVSLWIDGVLKETVAGVDNDTRRIDEVRLGPNSGIDAGTSGTEYYDAFESRRQTYIGPVQPPVAGGERITKTYYFAGTQLVAMREITGGGGVLYYLHSDHLGSTSLTTDSSGNEIARQSYYPFGQIRASSGSMPTDIGFTGQRVESASLGSLMFFRARFYSPALGRFLSADTIVPEPGNSQAWNRYSYTVNNPLRYIDPTGHATCEDMPWECDENASWLDDQSPQTDPVAGMFDTGFDFGEVNTEGDTDADDLLHPGIDVSGAADADGNVIVVAPAYGRIRFYAENGGFGNYAVLLVLDGQGGYYQLIFGHMRDDNTYGLRNGQWVNMGDPIGIVGSTGNSTGNHLHYEVRHDPDMRLTDTGFTSDNRNLQGRQLYYPRREILEQGELFINPWRFRYLLIRPEPIRPEIPISRVGRAPLF